MKLSPLSRVNHDLSVWAIATSTPQIFRTETHRFSLANAGVDGGQRWWFMMTGKQESLTTVRECGFMPINDE